MKRALTAAVIAALALAGAAAAFDNTEPDAAEQWYLTQDQAWSYWSTMPVLAPIRVAVIDSGIDYGVSRPGRRRALVRLRLVEAGRRRSRHLRRR